MIIDIPLWTGPAPESRGTQSDDIPNLTVFLPKKTAKPTSAVVICPGGGYGHLAFDREGTLPAQWFQERGIAGFALKYRLPGNGYRHPVPLRDAQRALRLVRACAPEWNLDPSRIGVMGFSAGGHLASTLETHFDKGDPRAADPIDRISCRPDFAVLVYPVITLTGPFAHQGSRNNLLGPSPDPALVENLSSERRVTPQTPPTFLVHSLDDKGVPVENSRLMLAALKKAGVPAQLQEYPTGGHGFSFKPAAPEGWLDQVGKWLQTRGLMP
jgi:acetyl esterase/lipase